MRKIVLTASLALALGGCVNHTFAPGPGKSSFDFEPDSARCRLFARGSKPGFAFGASGSEKFVASATAGAAIGYGISAVMEENQNYNDCMMANDWRVADGGPVSQDAAMDGRLAVPYQVAAVTPLAPPQSGPQPTGQPLVRRDLLIRGKELTPYDAEMLRMIPKSQGVRVTELDRSGAGAQAGLKSGDIITAFDGKQIHGLRDLMDSLEDIPPGARISATIWRNQTQQTVEIQF